MKKLMRICLALLLTAMLLCGSAMAAATNVNFTTVGSDQVFVFTSGKDLFANFKNVLPGDTITQTITVQNTSKHLVRLWLMAFPADEYVDADFLNQMRLTVTAEGGDIFEAAANQQAQLAPTEKSPYGVLLGTFKNQGTAKLNVTLEVPASMGNEYMGRVGVIPWTFTAEEVVLPDTPDTGDDFTMWIWIFVGGVLVVALVWLIVGRRKQKTP